MQSGFVTGLLRLFPISPLSTGFSPYFLLLRLGWDVHGPWVIGTAVPASPKDRQRCEGAAGDQGSDLRRPALPKLFRERKRGQPGRGAGRGNCLLRDAVPEVLRSFGEQSGTQERLPQEGPWNIGRDWPELRFQPGRAGPKTSEPSGGAVE
jgi:hypothetical protein